MISTAAGASAIGAAIDTLFNGALSGFSNSAMELVMRSNASRTPSNVNVERSRSNKFAGLSHQRDSWNGQSSYSTLFDSSTYRPDITAAVLCLLMTLVLISGVKKSVKFNNYLNLFNAAVFLFIIIAALPLLSLKYWKTDFYNNQHYNATTSNYLDRSRQAQTGSKSGNERTSYRVPYQRGLINRWESENTYFDGQLSKHLVKRSSLSNKFNSINSNEIKLKRTRRSERRQRNYSFRTKFQHLIHLINQRFRRSISFDEDNRKKTDEEHESRMSGFGDDDDEEEEPSIVTAGKLNYILFYFF